MENIDTWTLGGKSFTSRFILGSGKYSSSLIKAAIDNAEAQIITVAVRRALTSDEDNIMNHIPQNITILPNTSGARTAEEAIKIAHLARELSGSNFIKIEIMRDTKYLFPDNDETIKATQVLAKEDFVVMPYMFPDLNAARKLQEAGAAAIMPLAAPIGSNQGLVAKEFCQIIIEEITDLPIIIDAGIGRPSDATLAMEIGATAIMANTALATAKDTALMAKAFALAIKAGRTGYLAGIGRTLIRGGQSSSPLTGFLR